MIADNTEGPIETFLKLVTAPMWLPLYFGYLGCLKLAEVWAKKAKLETPATEMERAVYAALILAGEPVNNRRLAELMDCSPGEASKRVTRLEGVVRKVREGREVMIGLH